jgi:hypothetical protein
VVRCLVKLKFLTTMQTTDVNQAEVLRNAAEAAMREHGFEPEFSAAVIREVRSLDEPADGPLPG